MESKKKTSKVKLLVSFKSKEEISGENIRLVDILDLKDPIMGSLGSWKIKSIKEIIRVFGKKKKISATLGDIKKTKDVLKKLEKFDQLNLDYIKFGLFSETQNQIEDLMNRISERKIKTKLVPVIFADFNYTKKWIFNNLEKIRPLGFKYIILDTYSKHSGNLIELCSMNFLEKFVNKSSRFKINVGLAGKLKAKHIPKLLSISPNILGFRSAACKSHDRNSSISNSKIKELHSFLSS